MVRSRPSKTQLTNLHGSSITSSRLDSLMTKPSLPNLKLATNSVDFINFKPSQSKWVIPLWRRMPETQFLERGVWLTQNLVRTTKSDGPVTQDSQKRIFSVFSQKCVCGNNRC